MPITVIAPVLSSSRHADPSPRSRHYCGLAVGAGTAETLVDKSWSPDIQYQWLHIGC